MFIARMNGVVVSKDDIKIRCSEKEPVTSSSDSTEHVSPSQRSGDVLIGRIAKDITQGIKDPLQQDKVPIAELFCDPKLRLHLLMGNLMWYDLLESNYTKGSVDPIDFPCLCVIIVQIHILFTKWRYIFYLLI